MNYTVNCQISSPIGTLFAEASNDGVTRLQFSTWGDLTENDFPEVTSLQNNKSEKILLQLNKELSEYFQQKRQNFTVPLVLAGTDFQKSAWQVLLNIPYGETLSYSKQAEYLGNKNKARAVALANKNNKIVILIPCHRVISKTGKISGYNGHPCKKIELLSLEDAHFI